MPEKQPHMSACGYRGVGVNRGSRVYRVRVQGVYCGSYSSPHIAAAVADAAFDLVSDTQGRNYREGFWENSGWGIRNWAKLIAVSYLSTPLN